MINIGMNANDNDNYDQDDIHDANLPPLIRLLIVHPETPTSNPADVTAIGLAEIEIYGGRAMINLIDVTTFGANHPCTREDLNRVLFWPEAIDGLVTYDLSRAGEMVQAGLQEVTPWIGIGRLLVRLGHDIVDRSAEAIASELGLGRDLAQAPTDTGRTWREAAATALLAAMLHEQLGLERMIALSSDTVRPLRSLPKLDDALGWAAMPNDDVDWVANNHATRLLAGLNPDPAVDDAVTRRAVRELHRRRLLAHQS